MTELEAQLEQTLGEMSVETLVQRLGGLLASSLEALPVEKMWVCWWGSQAEAVYWIERVETLVVVMMARNQVHNEPCC